MDEEFKTVSEIVGILRRNKYNAKQVIEITEKAKMTYLERCRHVTDDSNMPKKSLIKSNDSCNCRSL